MLEILGVELDTKNMTLEELEKTRKEVRDLLAQLDYQIATRKLAEHKHSSL